MLQGNLQIPDMQQDACMNASGISAGTQALQLGPCVQGMPELPDAGTLGASWRIPE
jgi:hypothetical protein